MGRKLEPRFSWTESKELFHLEKRRVRRMWSLTLNLRRVVMVQKRHVLLTPKVTL